MVNYWPFLFCLHGDVIWTPKTMLFPLHPCYIFNMFSHILSELMPYVSEICHNLNVYHWINKGNSYFDVNKWKGEQNVTFNDRCNMDTYILVYCYILNKNCNNPYFFVLFGGVVSELYFLWGKWAHNTKFEVSKW